MNRKVFSNLIIAAIFFVCLGFTGTVYAQTDGYGSGDGIGDSVVIGDSPTSLANLIEWWKANSGIEMDQHEPRFGECKKVVGFRFDFGCNWDGGDFVPEGKVTEDLKIFYCAIDVSREKIILNQRPDPDSVTDIYWSFQATVYYECDTPTLTLTPSPASIDVGEDSTVDIQIDCFESGGVGGMLVILTLETGSPGTLSDHEVTTDSGGHASVTFHADGEGTATVNAQVLACSKEDNTHTKDSDCQIEVGGRKLQIDLIYIGEVTQGIQFMSSFVHRMKIAIEASDAGVVSGSGDGQTTFDFEYENDTGEVYSENWQSGGFTTCEAEGTFDGETFTINIDTTGNISFVHVVEIPGQEPIRIPIEESIDWEQLLAEPVVIGADDDATFSASGSFSWGLTYIINAKWVRDEGEG